MKQFIYSNYDYNEYFTKLGTIIPNREAEKLEIEYADGVDTTRKGLIYILVIQDKIFKIGQTTDAFDGRLGSYNCGRQNNRDKGTCSVTNYFVLQSLLAINRPVDVYVYYPPRATYELFEQMVETSEAPSKYGERLIVEDFLKKYYKKPIGCTQS
jgi:hypothetical protein